jgi:hypothetical protein
MSSKHDLMVARIRSKVKKSEGSRFWKEKGTFFVAAWLISFKPISQGKLPQSSSLIIARDRRP